MEEKREFLDRDQDGVDDRVERIIDYILALVLLLITVPAFFLKMIDFEDVKIVFYLVVGLSGGMTMLKGILKELLKNFK
jgi:lipopolysaccharide/colanic/teichoic acid biosynthesis glycosyltransferase